MPYFGYSVLKPLDWSLRLSLMKPFKSTNLTTSLKQTRADRLVRFFNVSVAVFALVSGWIYPLRLGFYTLRVFFAGDAHSATTVLFANIVLFELACCVVRCCLFYHFFCSHRICLVLRDLAVEIAAMFDDDRPIAFGRCSAAILAIAWAFVALNSAIMVILYFADVADQHAVFWPFYLIEGLVSRRWLWAILKIAFVGSHALNDAALCIGNAFVFAINLILASTFRKLRRHFREDMAEGRKPSVEQVRLQHRRLVAIVQRWDHCVRWVVAATLTASFMACVTCMYYIVYEPRRLFRLVWFAISINFIIITLGSSAYLNHQAESIGSALFGKK